MSNSEYVSAALYSELLEKFKKLDNAFKQNKELINAKHLENLEFRKDNKADKERVIELEAKLKDKMHEI